MQRLLFAFAMMSLCLCAQDRQLSPDAHFYSREKEAALGAQLALQVRRQTTPLGVVDADEYVTSLGGKLAAQLSDGRIDWSFRVIRDQIGGSTFEPLSLPGGYIFVPAQLILAADNEAEFAGVLAHAMEHIAERQATRQLASADAAQATTIPLIFVGGPAGFAGDDESVMVPVAFLKTHRQNELDADRAAVGAMAAVGYDPNALLNYIGRTQRWTSQRPEEFSPLPPLSRRLSNLEQAIQNVRRPGSYIYTGSFQSIQNQVRAELMRGSTPGEAHQIRSLHPEK